VGWSKDGSEVERGRSERREQPGRIAGFLVVEAKNAWGGGDGRERVKPGDAGWDSRALKALKGSGTFKIPNSSFFLFFSALCTHQVPVVSLYELGELACRRGPESKSPPSLLFSN
jgi:hypothetical protein